MNGRSFNMGTPEVRRVGSEWVGHVAASYGDTAYSVGRYELNKPDGLRMRVDYAIDPTLPFGRYGKFYSFFVSRFDPGKQVVEYTRIVIDNNTPKVGMGSFDFKSEDNKRELQGLLASGIRHDVAQVLRDVLSLSENEMLEKASQACIT